MDEFYARRSLNIEVYNERIDGLPVVDGDAEFYLELARQATGPVLELGCGTGRLVIPLAQDGIAVTGLDRSQAMLDEARRALRREPQEVRSRVTLLDGDMTSFKLGQQFGLIYIAFRSFMMLTTPEEQRACLACAHSHLAPGGLLAINLFDPLLDRLVEGPMPESWRSVGRVIHPESNNRVFVDATDRMNDVVAQVFEETWRFMEFNNEGAVVRTEEEVLRMRWTYRYEMRYLLELSGFEVLAEYADYHKSPPGYGKEQVWVARKR